MAWQWTPYTAPLFLAAAVSILSAVYVLRQQQTASARTGAVLLLAAAVWIFGYALDLSSYDLATKLFWTKLKSIGVCTVPLGWLVFVIQRTGREQWLTRRRLALMSVVPLITLVLTFTNEMHGLVFSQVWLDTSGPFAVRRSTTGVWLWVYQAYSHSLVAVSIFLLGQTLVRSRYFKRWQAGILLFAAVFTWLVTLVTDALGLNPLPNRLEVPPLLLSIAAPAIAWSLYRLERLDVTSVARDAVLESMGDSVIVLDAQNRIVDLNPAAQRLVGCSRSAAIGQPVDRVWPEWPGRTEVLRDGADVCGEVVLGLPDAPRTYHWQMSPVSDRRGHLISRVAVLRDITEVKRQALELSTVLETTRAVSSMPDLERLLSLIADAIINVTNVDGCTLSRWDRVADAVDTWIERRTQDLEWADEVGTAYPLADFPATRAVLETRQPLVVHVSDPNADPAEVAQMRQVGSKSLLMLPLAIGDRVIGLVELDQSEYERDFTADEIRLCQALADQAAIAIENARLYEQAQREIDERRRAERDLARANALITALSRVAAHIETTPNPEQVMRSLGTELKRLGLTCLVALLEPDSQALVIHYTSIESAALTRAEKTAGLSLHGFRIPWQPWPSSNVASGPRARLLPDLLSLTAQVLPNVPRPVLRRAIELAGLTPDTSIVYLPLMVEDHSVGGLAVWGREFREEDLPAFAVFANQVAVAIRNAQLHAEVQQLAITDTLTQLYNRRGIFELGRREVERARRFGRPLAALMFDLDHFKRVNDGYGHAVGDQMLAGLAECCRAELRRVDLLGRYGGEEFVALLPEIDLTTARQVAERLRQIVAHTPFDTAVGPMIITISVGVAALDAKCKGLEALLEHADLALYAAKRAGRNRVSLWEGEKSIPQRRNTIQV